MFQFLEEKHRSSTDPQTTSTKCTCELAASAPGHAASRPDWRPCPGPSEPWRDEKTGRLEGSADKEPAVAGRRRGHRKLPSAGEM